MRRQWRPFRQVAVADGTKRKDLIVHTSIVPLFVKCRNVISWYFSVYIKSPNKTIGFYRASYLMAVPAMYAFSHRKDSTCR